MGKHGFRFSLTLAAGLVFFIPPLRAEFVYVANSADKTIAGYSVGTDGTLTSVPGSPFPGLSGTISLTVEPRGRFLYALGVDASTLLGYHIENNGALSLIPGSPYAQTSPPQSISADPNGNFLYLANLPDTVSGYRIEPNGSLTPVPGSPFAAGYRPAAVVVEPKGEYVYEINASDSSVWGYHIESNGALVPAVDSPFAVGYPGYLVTPGVYMVPTLAKGELVYINNFELYVYSVQCQGALVQYPGLPVSDLGINGPGILLIDPKGEFAFMETQFANQPAPVLVTCKIGDQGELTPIPSTEIPAADLVSVAIDSTGAFLFLINSSTGLTVYGIRDDGSLTPVKGSPYVTGIGPKAVAVTPNARHSLVISH